MRRLLVVCEGILREPEYIEGFKRLKKRPTVDVEVVGEGADPSRVVAKARQLRDSAERTARRESDRFAAFDEVWCVFDRDVHAHFDTACQTARDNDLNLAYSNPCFELWLLLHFRESPGDQHRHHVQRTLRDFLPAYDKALTFADVAEGVADARDRARRLNDDAERMGEAGRNPTTLVYRLLDAIEQLA